MQRPVDNGTEPTITERDSSNGSRKRERDSWEEEPTERRPSKRRHSEEEVTRLEEEEEVQTLLEPWEDAVEPLPEISLILRSENGEQFDCICMAREFPALLTDETCRVGPNK
jgi:hypothetical protein